MPSQISSKEILIYLNHLGYNNVNAQQLKEFIQDLKKLIKYEERKKSKNNSEHKNSTVVCSDAAHQIVQAYPNCTDDRREVMLDNRVPDIFTVLYSQGTHSSKAKIVPKKESVISLQIKKSKCHHRCVQENKENIAQNSVNSRNENEVIMPEEERQKSKDEEKQQKIVDNKKPSKRSKSRTSVIRPQIPVNNKSDPVALYHYYKSGWDRYTFPGESQRSDLRWAVREKMLSGPRLPRP